MSNEATTTPTLTLTEAFPDPAAARLRILEAALFMSAEPLSVAQLKQLFDVAEKVDQQAIEDLLAQLQQESELRGVKLVEVAGGWRYQTRQEYQPWLLRLQEDRPRRYGRALLETLALIAYRQPITRGEIEEVRGVAVATSVMRALLERRWIKPVGRRDIPGRPITFGTTETFLNDFGLQQLSDLPTLTQIKSMSELEPGFDFDGPPDSELSFAQILGAYQTAEEPDDGDDLEANLMASWQSTDATNSAFTQHLQAFSEPQPDASAESSRAAAEPTILQTDADLAMTEREIAELIAVKTREQQQYLERQNNSHEENDDNPQDPASDNPK